MWRVECVVECSILCVVLYHILWCVRMIDVCGVCVLWYVVFRVVCTTMGVVDVVCRWCVLRCGVSYTTWCTGGGRSGSVVCGII